MKEFNHRENNQATYQKTIPCRYFLNGHCRFGQNCRYSHYIIECYLMRHAQSLFNQILNQFEHDANSNQAKDKYQIDESLIDCGITQRGVKQIDQICFPPELENKGKIRFDIIFVSPMERCLKTLDRCLLKHKIKSKKVIVLPGLTEVLSKICDFGTSIQQKKTKYQKYDFSYIKELNEKEWQDQLVDPQFKSMIQEKQFFGVRYMEILRQIFPKPLENGLRCFNRALQTLEQIRHICQTENANKILIVSHNRIIRYIMGRRNRGRSQSIENCQIKYTVI